MSEGFEQQTQPMGPLSNRRNSEEDTFRLEEVIGKDWFSDIAKKLNILTISCDWGGM